MGKLKIFNTKSKKSSVPAKRDDMSVIEEKLDEYIKKTSEQIKKGDSKPTASNGTPMEKLSGAAEIAARAKNIGRESKPDGGMLDGYNTIANNQAAKAMKAGIKAERKKNNKKGITKMKKK